MERKKPHSVPRKRLYVTGRALGHGLGQGIRYRELWRGYTGKCEVRRTKDEAGLSRGHTDKEAR
jgi:hypothetical protein